MGGGLEKKFWKGEDCQTMESRCGRNSEVRGMRVEALQFGMAMRVAAGGKEQ